MKIIGLNSAVILVAASFLLLGYCTPAPAQELRDPYLDAVRQDRQQDEMQHIRDREDRQMYERRERYEAERRREVRENDRYFGWDRRSDRRRDR